MDYIKNSILHGELNNLFDLHTVDWKLCHEYSLSSIVKIACDLWNNGLRNHLDIAKKLKLDRTTIVRYLKSGFSLGICDYDSKKYLKEVKSKYGKINNCKKVICLITGEIFYSLSEASRVTNVNPDSISNNCKGKLKYTGKLENGTQLMWMFYDEYLKLNKIQESA